MNPHKPGTKLHRAYEVFASQGAEAAQRIGTKEIGLNQATLRIWIPRWTKGVTPTYSKTKKMFGGKPPKGRRVRMRSDRTWKGVVTEEGPEQSGVKWDNGMFQYLSNHHLEDLVERRR